MKTKKIKKKLVLTKETVANLDLEESKKILGGADTIGGATSCLACPCDSVLDCWTFDVVCTDPRYCTANPGNC